MSLWDFARLAGLDGYRQADFAAILSESLLYGTTRTATGEPRPRGDLNVRVSASRPALKVVPGAGLLLFEDRLVPFVFADSEASGLAPGVTLDLQSSPLIREIVANALEGVPEWASFIRVLPIATPLRQAAPGSQISGPQVGTIGTQVSWSTGTGFLTAGHVAPSVSAKVYEANSHIGYVAWANDPAGHGAAIEPDVAVIELLAGVTIASPIPSAAAAGPAASISVLSTGAAGSVMGLSHFLHMGHQNATCGDTYFTTSQMTTGGDSGGPVMLGSDVIGHVVGASPGITSFIQDVQYQLREAANPLRSGLTGLRI